MKNPENLEINYTDPRTKEETTYSFGINSNYCSHAPEHFKELEAKLQTSCQENIKSPSKALLKEQITLSRLLSLAKSKGLYGKKPF